MIKINIILVVFSILLINACAPINVFDNVQLTEDETYGYTPENPIRMGYWDMRKSMHANMFFISRLLTEDNQKLNWIMHASVDSPYDNTKKYFHKDLGQWLV